MSALESQEPFLIRHWEPERDIGFVRDSWIRSGEKVTRHLIQKRLWDKALYLKHQRMLVTALLQRSASMVACNPAHQDQIYGWACAEPPREDGRGVLHYIYVKEPFRRTFGISGALLDGVGCGRGSATWCTTWSPWATKEQKARIEMGLAPFELNLWKLWGEA